MERHQRAGGVVKIEPRRSDREVLSDVYHAPPTLPHTRRAMRYVSNGLGGPGTGTLYPCPRCDGWTKKPGAAHWRGLRRCKP